MHDSNLQKSQSSRSTGKLRWIASLVAVAVAVVVAINAASAKAANCVAAPAIEAEIDMIVDAAMAQSGTPGIAVGIIIDGKVAYLKGRGVTRRGGPSLVDCHTRFHVASLSKPVVATAIMTAFERGEMQENATLSDLTTSTNATASIANLMTHTAGMRDWLRAAHRETAAAKQDYFNRILRRAERVAGTRRFRYSDTDYNLLGWAIEKGTSRDLDGFVRERVFEPLGMSESHFIYEPGGDPNSAWPHVGRQNDPADRHPYDVAFAASSGLQASARDMVLFLQAYLGQDPSMMSQASYLRAVEPRHPSEWDGISQSLVWQVFQGQSGATLQHGGSDKGFRALLTIYHERQAGIVILANGERLDRWALRKEIERVIAANAQSSDQIR